MDLTENNLLAQFVVSPNHALLKMVVTKYYSFVYSACFRVLERSDLADDAAQATFLILSKKASNLKPSEKLIGWLHRTAYLSALWLKRQEKQRMKLEQKKPLQNVEILPDEAIDRSALKSTIDLALNQMPDNYRIPIFLKFYEEKSYLEIGMMMNLSEEAVRKKVQRGLIKLESILKSNKVQLSLELIIVFLEQKMIEVTTSESLVKLISGCDNLGSISQWNGQAVQIFNGVEKMLYWSKLKALFVLATLVSLISISGVIYLNGEETPISNKKTLRVLLIADNSSSEYNYLAPSLLRDQMIGVSCYLQSKNNDSAQQGIRVIKELPKTQKEWDVYQVVILLDVDASSSITPITSDHIDALENFTKKGGGLIVISGGTNSIANLVKTHRVKISSMLPVEVDPNDLSKNDKVSSTPIKLVRTNLGKAHPILLASSNESNNKEIWSTFPTFICTQSIKSIKPSAISLLEKEGGGKASVVMAIHRFGDGAVFFIGISDFWRWKLPNENSEYDRFWIRVIHYLGKH